MEHALHLTAQHFIQSVAPNFNKNGPTSGADPKGNASSDKDDSNDSNKDDDIDSDDDESANNGDSLGEAIGLVMQVLLLSLSLISVLTLELQIHKSPQARTFFHETCSKLAFLCSNFCCGFILIGVCSSSFLMLRIHWDANPTWVKGFLVLSAAQTIVSLAHESWVLRNSSGV
jgi:hypothetical protein